MEKRGQVTIFIIVGMLILIVVGLLIFLQQTGIGLSPVKFLADREDDVKDEFSKCVDKIAIPAINTLGLQGGTFSPTRFRLYNGQKVNYLCYNQQDRDTCINRMLLLSDIESDLNNHLRTDLKNCMDDTLENLRAGSFTITKGNFKVETTIGKDNTLIVVNYPIVLTRNEARLDFEDFSKTVDMPLGRLYEATYDIVSAESRIGDFDQLPYMLIHKNLLINKDRPYPDKIYIIQETNNPFIFQFAIEGE